MGPTQVLSQGSTGELTTDQVKIMLCPFKWKAPHCQLNDKCQNFGQ